ncbi:MAG: zinc ribbon domain-containing protein [Paraburkholderia sp.]|uniref:zinc ribbon domain-containing protein n=1 Tax=Paraburkholderia sp. TaxID=1926495 RepID=UPI00121FB134|nr:zinc ribbon domain-containing protein [Paraburkholderia sp.]TAL98003.1 MAG: zinc ribbon domain-containing protein [Paraburkholderia sp.]
MRVALTAIRNVPSKGTAYNWWVEHMSTQTSPGRTFPTPCKRCGGALYPPDETCPWCGASHAVAYGVRLKAASHAQAHAPVPPDVAPDIPADVAQPAGHAQPLMLPDTPIPPLDMPEPVWRSAGRWIFSKGLVLTFFLFALGYAGYTLFSEHKSDTAGDEPAATSTSGSIQPYQSAPSARPSQGVTSIAPVTPAPATPVAQTPSTRRQAAAASPSIPPIPTLPPLPDAAVAVTPVAPPIPSRTLTRNRDVPGSLQVARASLQTNDLAGAQAALSEALATQPDNADARLMQQDLLQRLLKRDAFVRAANACLQDRLWSCVRHNASDALAVDSSSNGAKTLLERSIREAGWNSPALPTARGGAQATAPGAAVAAAAPPARTPRPAAPRAPAAAVAAPAPVQTNVPAPAVIRTPASPTPAATQATDANSIDARERAIRESGWSHPATRGASATSTTSPTH